MNQAKPYDFIWFSPDCSIFSMIRYYKKEMKKNE